MEAGTGEVPDQRREILLSAMPRAIFYCDCNFGPTSVFFNMKTGLKIFLVLIAALLVLKLMPVILVMGGFSLAGLVVVGGLLVAALGVLVLLGVSVSAAVLAVALVVAVALSPIWVPVLAVIGLIFLLKKAKRRMT
jgi:hypothetical protein